MLDDSQLDVESIRALYEVDGLSIAEIADIYNHSTSKIRRVLRRAGSKLRSRSEAMRLKRAKDTDRLVNIPASDLQNLYVELKLSTLEIARKYGCSLGTVLNHLHRLGIGVSSPGRARVDVSADELEKLYIEQGLSLREIAMQLGCDHSTIRNKLHIYGISSRSYSEANRVYPRQDFDGDNRVKAYLIGFRLGDLYVTAFGTDRSTIVVNTGTTKQD